MNTDDIHGSIEVKQTDIIRLILQYLQQNNLLQSFQCLQRQSKVALNTIDKQYLHDIIMSSEWPKLFKQLNYLMPSQQNLFDLYEMIVDDLIQKDCFVSANYVINKCFKGKDFQSLSDIKQRVLRLQYICQNPDQKAVYQNPVTKIRKQNLISRLIKQTHQQVQTNRLLTVIGESLKYQAHSGLIKPNISMSLFENKQHEVKVQTQELIKSQDKLQKYSQESRISAIKFSNNGQYFALGGIDGLIQIYDPIQYNLHTGLTFQAQDILLYHDDPVTHLQFNETDQMLLSADMKGYIKLWGLSNGRLLRKIYFGSTIGSLIWGNDPTHILAAHQNIRAYGTAGCNVLRQYTCTGGSSNENEYIMEIFYSDLKIYSISQNATIRIHNYNTQQQMQYITNKNSILLNTLAIFSNSDQIKSIFICSQNKIIQYNKQLAEVSKINLADDQTTNSKYCNFTCVGNYIYQCVQNILDAGKIIRYKLNVRDKKTGKIILFRELKSRLTLMRMHKFRNLLITYNEQDELQFWRP